jgi:hypothetical protein
MPVIGFCSQLQYRARVAFLADRVFSQSAQSKKFVVSSSIQAGLMGDLASLAEAKTGRLPTRMRTPNSMLLFRAA